MMSYTYEVYPSEQFGVVCVASPAGVVRVLREDADPEDRRIEYRLAAAYFGNAVQCGCNE